MAAGVFSVTHVSGLSVKNAINWGNETTGRGIASSNSVLLDIDAAYGGMGVADGTTQQTGTDSSIVTVTSFIDEYPSLNVSANTTAGTLTIELSGTYFVFNQSSFTGTANTGYEGHLILNSSEHSFGWHRKLGAAGDEGSASFGGIDSFVTNDVLAVGVNTTSGSGNYLGVVDGQFTVHKLY